MAALVIGLFVFLGVHSFRIVAEDFRTRHVARLGLKGWKACIGTASLASFALLVWGYGEARQMPHSIWVPPYALREVGYALTVMTEILVVAAYLPGNRFKAWLGHPMLVGVMLWSVAHLLSNGNAHAMLVFVSFLVWAMLAYRAARRRDQLAGVQAVPGASWRTFAVIAIGAANWTLIAFLLHGWLIGVRPFG